MLFSQRLSRAIRIQAKAHGKNGLYRRQLQQTSLFCRPRSAEITFRKVSGLSRF